MIDLYSFQRRPDIVKSFGHSGSYTPSWSAARRQAIADDGDEDWWLDEHWDDPAEKKRLQYRANAIADPKRLPDRWIQACLWTITPHDVVDIRPA